MASSHRWKSLGAPPRKTSPRGRTSSHTTETMPGGGPLRPTPLLSRRVTYHKMPNPRPQHRSPIPYSAVHMARSRWASTEYPVMRLHHPGCSKAREQQRVVCQVGGASPARQRLAGSREILGACDRPCRASSDQIHTLGEFDRSLVTWPSATSLTSRRTSSWRCRVQICLPGVAQAAFEPAGPLRWLLQVNLTAMLSWGLLQGADCLSWRRWPPRWLRSWLCTTGRHRRW
jgi:hypothetical protein